MRPAAEHDRLDSARSSPAVVDGEGLRQYARRVIGERLPPGWSGLGALDAEEGERFVEQWRTAMADLGLLAPTWPREYGGLDATPEEYLGIVEEFALARAPMGGPHDTNGIRLLGNTILAMGTDAQREHFLPRILSGEHRWCQGFSEPGAGSDLAGVRTSAVLEGGNWHIDGQKVWTTVAATANWIFLLARTDPSAPRHRGLSFLLVPMDQPGVEVRPLRQISGGSEFNEVFFTDARCPADNLVGAPGEGWKVAMTMLGFERGSSARTLPIRLRAELDRLIALAEEHPHKLTASLRGRLAWCVARVDVLVELGELLSYRATHDTTPGAEAAVFKLMWSEYHRIAARLGVSILGRDALAVSGRHPSAVDDTDDPGAPNSSASWTSVLLNAQAGTIYAGTSNIQRNIIGERLLGLPR